MFYPKVFSESETMVFFAETPINSAYKSSYCFYLQANSASLYPGLNARKWYVVALVAIMKWLVLESVDRVSRKAERIRIMETVMTEGSPMNRA